MSRIRKLPTKMIRVRISDVKKLRQMAIDSQKKMPDFISELIRLHKFRRRR